LAARDVGDAVRDVADRIEQAIAQQVEFDPHWFRRAFHAFGAAFVAYYLLPSEGTVGLFRDVLPLAIFAGAVGLELYRMSGRVPTEAFFGLREYERRRVSGYVYFGFSVLLLVYLFPQPIAVACILAAAIGDPIVGEFRRANLPAASVVAGSAFVLGVFLLIDFHPLLAVFGTALMIVAERVKIRWLDDDFLMPMLPAAALYAITASGLFAALGIGLPPDPITTTVEVPSWLA